VFAATDAAQAWLLVLSLHIEVISETVGSREQPESVQLEALTYWPSAGQDEKSVAVVQPAYS
jgi:hypothetical protein